MNSSSLKQRLADLESGTFEESLSETRQKLRQEQEVKDKSAQLQAQLKQEQQASDSLEAMEQASLLKSQALLQETQSLQSHPKELFTPPTQDWRLGLAERYVHRGKWSKIYLKRLVLMGGLAGLGWGGVSLISYFLQESALGDARAVATHEQQVEKNIQDMTHTFQVVTKNYQGSGFEAPKGLSQDFQHRLIVLQEKSKTWQPMTLNRAWVKAHSTLISQNEMALSRLESEVSPTMGSLIAFQNHWNSVKQWNQISKEPWAGAMQPLIGPIQTQWADALKMGTTDGLKKITPLRQQLQGLKGINQMWTDVAAMVNNGSSEEKSAMAPLFSQALDSAQNQDYKGTIERLINITAQHKQFNATYDLRISDGTAPGTQSGFWRYQNNNRDARTYYIVVDAIGPDGSRFKVPVTSIETGKTLLTSHFAVRVPQSAYESVKADKLDNGIIDQRLFGHKKSGTLNLNYDFPVEGGFITSW